MILRSRSLWFLLPWVLVACGDSSPTPMTPARPAVLDLWSQGIPAFGIFVPDERPAEDRGEPGARLPALYTAEGGQRLAENPLLDYLFLNMEGRYDPQGVSAIVSGVRNAGSAAPPAVLVRLPSVATAGEEETRTRIREVLAMGADGVVIPHIRTQEEAERVIGFVRETGADVWSPENPTGRIVAMLMVEDPEAAAQAPGISRLEGFSILACGIGSMTSALGGDREAAEVWNRFVFDEATAAGRPSMTTANPGDIVDRIEQGFLALLTSGPQAEEAIRIGRAAIGR
jgi:2-keto-3-deoxy-L-rhamnonate aldolase RhmA